MIELDQHRQELLASMKNNVDEMKNNVDEIEKIAGIMHADFYRAHYEGCVRLCDLVHKYEACEPHEREILKKEMLQLAASLEQGLPLLRIHNSN